MEGTIEAVTKGGTVSATVPVAALKPSPTNPRKAFDKGRLAELAESIKAKGVLQPLLVRPLGPGAGMQIVAGERRWKAAKAAGLEQVPVVVREMTDAEVLEAQLVENLQRDDLHPLDEAEGYEQLLKLQGGRAPEDASARPLTVEDLAAKVGKSRGYVYGRLKLCALVPEARKAFQEGKLSASTALLVARIPVPELQKEAVKEITTGYSNGEADAGMSVREAAQYIQENYMLRLAEAPWPTADAQLVPAAGACTACPKRTGNQRELFGDVKSPDVCTDPKCFAAKKAAWEANLRADAEASGRTVISGKEAKAIKPHEYESKLKGYVDLSQSCYEDPKQRTYQALLGKHAEKAALLEDPHTKELRAVMPAADVTKALKDKGYSWAERRRSSTNAMSENQRKRQKTARLESEVRLRIHDAIRTKVKALSREDLALVAESFYEDIWDEKRKRILQLWGWEEKDKRYGGRKDVAAREVPKLSAAELNLFLLDCALVGETNVSTWSNEKPEGLLAAAKRRGVDANGIRKAVQAEAKKAKPPKVSAAKTKPAGRGKTRKKA